MKRNLWAGAIIVLYFYLTMACSNLEKQKPSSLYQVKEEMDFPSPRTVSENPTSTPLSPQESLHSFRLPKGYRLEVVASEPLISEPVAIAWDGNGRMYVAQLETYMQSIDAKDQNKANSRIMLLEDTDNDGQMDKSSVFLDSLLLPRMILCVGNELLVNETHSFDIYAYSDSSGNGEADQKRSVFQTNKKAFGNVEHQRSGLDWNLDNWIYVTIDPVRFKYKDGVLQVDSLVSGSNGQWGLTHDNYGRLFFSRAAAGMAATGFQINPVYGQLDFEDAHDSTFSQVWPIIKTPDVNGGPRTLREDSTLRNFTAVAGQSIYRGDRLPQSMMGDYIVAEPVGRLIRRAEVSQKEGITTLQNFYHQEEFISSTDLNFRPINTYTGPDGCLYIVDMYRGIIQESTWAQPGSFLFSQIRSKGLDKNVKKGRIYRLLHEDMQPGPKPKMLDEPTSTLVSYLDHPNGWWRDNAQKEIIVREDKSAVPALLGIVRGEQGPLPKPPTALARLHALWTLEGLEEISKEILASAMQDNDPQVRKAAVQISEPYLKENNIQLIEKLESINEDENYEVRAQILLSLQNSHSEKARALVNKITTNHSNNRLIAGILKSLEKNEEAKKYGAKLIALKENEREMVIKGKTIFQSLCAACHGPEGEGLPTNMAPPLIGKFKLIENKEGLIKIMLHGLKGPVDGETYAEIMPAMGTNDDEWIASVLNYVRFDLAMRSFPEMPQNYLDWVIIQPEQVKEIREEYTHRKKPWTWEEIMSSP